MRGRNTNPCDSNNSTGVLSIDSGAKFELSDIICDCRAYDKCVTCSEMLNSSMLYMAGSMRITDDLPMVKRSGPPTPARILKKPPAISLLTGAKPFVTGTRELMRMKGVPNISIDDGTLRSVTFRSDVSPERCSGDAWSR